MTPSFLKIDQKLVETVISRADALPYGNLQAPETPMGLDQWEDGGTAFALAMLLISAYANKYDQVALMEAIITIAREAETAAAGGLDELKVELAARERLIKRLGGELNRKSDYIRTCEREVLRLNELLPKA